MREEQKLQERNNSFKDDSCRRVEEWLKVVFRAKLGKHTHVHGHAVTDIALNHFLEYFKSDSSSLPKTAATPPSNIITAMLKVYWRYRWRQQGMLSDRMPPVLDLDPAQ